VKLFRVVAKRLLASRREARIDATGTSGARRLLATLSSHRVRDLTDEAANDRMDTLQSSLQMSSRLHVMQSLGKKSFRSPTPSTPSSDASSF
jgi:hypothetical protein